MSYTKKDKVYNKLFGGYVRECRIARGFTQEEFGERIGSRAQNVYRIEVGGISPTLLQLRRLAKGFDQSLYEFLQGFGNYKG